MLEDIGHYCGVGAVCDPQQRRNVAPYVGPLLGHLEHRGTGACGAAFYERSDGAFRLEHRVGRASQVLQEVSGNTASAIFHTLYKTNPDSRPHPFVVEHGGRRIAVAFNGNIPPTEQEAASRKFLADHGLPCETRSDTEMLAKLVAWHLEDCRGSMRKAFSRLPDHVSDGAYTLVSLRDNGDIDAFRDPRGFHPLSLGVTDDGLHVLSSETNALRLTWPNARQIAIRNVEPGSAVHLGPGVYRPESEEIFRPDRAHCAFEWAYFANRLSTLDDVEVRKARTMFGEALAKLDNEDRSGWKNAAVVPVPDSARIAAEGYADLARIRRADALIKNVDSVRSFIAHADREQIIREKFNIDASLITGRDVVLIDDSLVRGTTMQVLLGILRQLSPTSRFHVRFAYPPVTAPCFYGIDFSTRKELLVPQFSPSAHPEGDTLPADVLAHISAFIGADSVKFLPVSAVHQAIGMLSTELCRACFTGEYPTQGAQKLYDIQLKNA